ncbi:MAG: VWA domain-containing protein [Vulcanimicrobiota bacterium]
MSTTETAVAEEQLKTRSPSERATALGPGLLRRANGTFLRPIRAEVAVRCSGPLAHWTVKCVFPEFTDQGEETPLFLYPLPDEAALSGLALGGETLLPGPLQVRSLEELPEEVALSSPLPLLQQFGDEQRPVFTLQLDPWAEALSGLEVEIEYCSGLPTEDGRIRLALPSAVSSNLQAEGTTSIDISVTIEESTELVDDPIGPEGVESNQDGELLTLKGTFDKVEEPLDISFRPGRTQMPVRRLLRDDNHFIFSIYPPTSIPASPQRRDIVFAVDASENLDPDHFSQIREELCETLRNLDENDRFALVTFGRDIDGYDGGEFCDIEKVEAACEWLEGIEPKGRPDVQPLLQRIQALPAQEDRQLCIFLLAAGHVGNEPAILRSLDFDQSDRRYYTVGLGGAVQQSFLRRLALLTRGRCEVSPNGGCYQAVERLLGQTRALLAEVDFEDQNGDAEYDSEQLVPSRMTSLTPHGPVHCLGTGSPSSLRYRSKDETGVFFAGTVNAQTTENPALGGVWAGLRVREMLDSVNLTTGAKKKALWTEMADLAARYGVLTEGTVLVLESDQGLIVQYSVLPAEWRGVEPKEKKNNNVSNKDASAPFDWRKGLVAREGLFKGKSPGDSGESGGRYGLRSKGAAVAETSGKPRLDRAVLSATATDEDDDFELAEAVADEGLVEVAEEALETSAESDLIEEAIEELDSVDEPGEEETKDSADAEPEEPTEPAPLVQSTSAEVQAVPAAVPVVAKSVPVVHLQAAPFSAGKARMESYYSQLDTYDTELSLAAIQGLPEELSPRGGELPRILAQTVAHLEKRGYFSHAVSVLGLLLRDSPSPEVYKKMEGLIADWAASLPEESLPEAIQILQLGARACHGSEELQQKAAEAHSRWESLSSQQLELPAISRLRRQDPQPDLGSLLSQPQLEFARLQQEQAALAQQMVELREQMQQQMDELSQKLQLDELKQQLSVLPALLEQVVGRSPSAASASPPLESVVPTATQEPVAAVSKTEPLQPEAAPVVEAPQPEIAIPEPQAEAAPEPEPEPEPESREESSEDMSLTKEELTEMLLADPRSEESREAVMASLRDPKDRVNFFRDMAKSDTSEPYHSFSLARAYRDAEQTKVAVVHYQKFLRAEKNAQAYLELADAYDELGKANLAASSRKAAEAFKE